MTKTTNTNNNFRGKVLGATILTAGALGLLTAHNSKPISECDVPLKGTVAETIQEVESAGADASSGDLLDVNHQPVDTLSRRVNVDGSPVVYDEINNPGKGDILRVSANPEACRDIGEIVIKAALPRQ